MRLRRHPGLYRGCWAAAAGAYRRPRPGPTRTWCSSPALWPPATACWACPAPPCLCPRPGGARLPTLYGYFSLPVLAGDSIVIRSLGYRNQYVIIPPDYQRQSYSVIVSAPGRRHRAARSAGISLRHREGLQRSLSGPASCPPSEAAPPPKPEPRQLMRRIFNNAPVTSAGNYRQTMPAAAVRPRPPHGHGPKPYSNNPLLNPFSWLKLIQQVKNGEFKKKEGVDY